MPRDGSGAGDNAIEAGHNIAHGATGDKASTGVDRSNKAAAMPEPESGASLEGMNASGGGNAVNHQGGNLESAAEKEAEKHT
ncbi:hypothetical protein MBLNU457_5917t1 [Dothideomycetes sp. NU457]